jgi:hypothetical protein
MAEGKEGKYGREKGRWLAEGQEEKADDKKKVWQKGKDKNKVRQKDRNKVR